MIGSRCRNLGAFKMQSNLLKSSSEKSSTWHIQNIGEVGREKEIIFVARKLLLEKRHMLKLNYLSNKFVRENKNKLKQLLVEKRKHDN